MRTVWTSYPFDLNSDSARRRMTNVSSICCKKFVRSSRTKAVIARTFGLGFDGTTSEKRQTELSTSSASAMRFILTSREIERRSVACRLDAFVGGILHHTSPDSKVMVVTVWSEGLLPGILP